MLKLKWICVAVGVVFCMVGVFAASTHALEGKAGEVIKTVEELKELEAKGLLSHGQVVSFTELIRDFKLTIPIVKTTDRRLEFTAPKTYAEFTEKNKGKAKIGSKGEITNYAEQGCPFPDAKANDPQAGVKAAWNFDLNARGDSSYTPDWEYFLTDSKGNIKTLGGLSTYLKFTRRTDRDPKPTLQAGEVWYKYIIAFSKPFSSKGLGQLQVKYDDPTREDDLWVYVPGLRRATRVGGGNRCDCLGGFVFNNDDANLWSGNTTAFNWKLLQEKEMLMESIHPYEEARQGKDYIPKAHFTKPVLERRKTWIIENSPKFSGYCYSKRLYYMDPECWLFMFMEMFDQQGNLWKTEKQNFGIFENPKEAGGGHQIFNVSGDTLDVKIFEAGPYYHHEITPNYPLPIEMFSLDYIRKMGR